MNWAYLAGLIDGEGTITLSSGKHTKDRRGVLCRATLMIANTHRPVLEEAREFIGMGHIYKMREASERHQASYQYRMQGKRLLPVLIRLRPHIIVKREQLGLALEWLRRRARQKTRPYEEWDKQAVATMRRLNSRGLQAHKFAGLR